MSYNNILEEEKTFKPEELAEELNIEEAENEEVFFHLTQALNCLQQLQGDDPVKWAGIESIVKAMNILDENAEIEFGETHITVTRDR